jgi:phospholipase A-2-activating protein
VDYFNGLLVTGGSDKVFNLYSYKAGNYTGIKVVTLTSEVISIKINKKQVESPIFVALGCRNGEIHVYDNEGNELLSLNHNSTISSLDFIDAETLVTGSWDGKAIVWSLSTQKPICEYKEGKHAVTVFYNKVNNYITSGSQDKALNIWDRFTGMKIKRVENAHNDIIREIADVDGSGMIITCSNDETVKIWSGDLEPIETLLGHTAFVFSVKALRLGFYASGGEDKTLKIWQENHVAQDIHLPGSVWSIAFDENNDIFTADSDGMVRSFTTDVTRKAEADVEEMFNKQILESSSKKSGMTEDDIRKLMTTQQMSTFYAM